MLKTCHLQHHGWNWKLEVIMLSEISQAEKDKYHMTSLKNIKKLTHGS